ncbi:hypothetical protein ISF_08849 [Cordyceps fumosorosea ARSEF 2679]|uniref:Deoxyribonuclease NucA/NucB domain-containing protein n=1 Tax=Cordyceps fumosorosea (strain ARSEF 2679) TaxID=1081104 RepID=A0A162K4V5_CORFA|nr:hypothetical protein ISF_08849 [Cordyceps fumosorosea ARSEF 2679]OAA53368.1 hypothetical protein ISF_08849 [Cordyceps fumosorosea ARSEF 2679]
MQLSASLLLAFCALGLQGAVGTPILEGPVDIGALDLGPKDDNTTELVARQPPPPGSTNANPIIAELDLDGTKMNMLPFEADCYAILCLKAPDVLQRVVGKVINRNRRTSGVCKSPFKRGKAKYKLDKLLPPTHNTWGTFDSPEEYPFASSEQGGTNAYLFPVSLASQNSQGGTLNGLLSKYDIKAYDPAKQGTPGATDRTWYKIEYKGKLGPYCTALMAKDTSVCNKNFDGKGDWGFDVADQAYKYNKGDYQRIPRV